MGDRWLRIIGVIAVISLIGIVVMYSGSEQTSVPSHSSSIASDKQPLDIIRPNYRDIGPAIKTGGPYICFYVMTPDEVPLKAAFGQCAKQSVPAKMLGSQMIRNYPYYASCLYVDNYVPPSAKSAYKDYMRLFATEFAETISVYRNTILLTNDVYYDLNYKAVNYKQAGISVDGQTMTADEGSCVGVAHGYDWTSTPSGLVPSPGP